MNPFRDLPSVDRLLQALSKESESLGHDAVRTAARSVLDEVRAQLRAGETPQLEVAAMAARTRALLTGRNGGFQNAKKRKSFGS